MPGMFRVVTILGLLFLAAGCKDTPEVDLGAPADTAVNELTSRQIKLAWLRSVKAAAKVVGSKEYCRFHAVFTRYEKRLTYDECLVEEVRCMDGGGDLNDILDSGIADAFAAACGVRVGDLEACLNDALKVVDRAAERIDCGDDPVNIDRKLPVPQTCEAIRDGCIIPVLVHLLRSSWEEDEGEDE